ncbi:MAG: fumarylacetoacetate hydrolase family protein [Desulfuromonadaceae bacterium]|nr:fumarylacetoacetate hydrolase family protein [Desulfuromonadaceae bacterium]MDD2849840.1 fumarylacetoacetate hydrolase family protein [Desulfuromonadaceae bacterium]MDD4131611.1 fumarylacetoacetate hydrolase family protein [Desulfuromonadaceae bacterium]
MTIRNVVGTDREFTIGKIVCLARNYAEHAKELGNETPAAPVLFMKPASSVIGDGDTVRIPAYSQECHYEVELALLIGSQCRGVSAEMAMEHVAGYGVAIDMTLRDVQNQLKAKGLPWEIAKGFDTSCPLSDFVPAAAVADPHALSLKLAVNGETRQDGNSSDMIHRVPQIVAHISAIFTLEPGDVILTGTPAGVGQVLAGDVMTAEIGTIGHLMIPVA